MKFKVAYIQSEQKEIARLVTVKFKNYYLTGGTALAFYFNHRFSEDLDFFSQKYTKAGPDEIMAYIKKETKYSFRLDSEQDSPGLVAMKVYFLELKKDYLLKIDFIQDYAKNINKLKNGLHSIADIYYRKILTAAGNMQKQDETGRVIHIGRQTVKDLFDIYYLSLHHQALSEFFFEYFSYDKAESLIAWYNTFDRTRLKIELLDLVPEVNTFNVLKHLDDELLKKIPDRLL